MLWVKAFHIISVITWFAALFYLPRLFVYHSMAQDEISIERFKVMERRLYLGIMMPSFVIATVLGVWMIQDYAWQAYAGQYWLLLGKNCAKCKAPVRAALSTGDKRKADATLVHEYEPACKYRRSCRND